MSHRDSGRAGPVAAKIRCARVAKDIENPSLGELDWSPNSRTDSLSKVFEHAMDVSNTAQRWYAGKHPSKRKWGRALRIVGLLLAGAGAIIPIISEISSKSGKPAIAPGWAAVALGLAAGCGILDRFFGFSSAWMRYIVAEQRLERQRSDFEYQWNKARTNLTTPPSDTEVEKLLTLARDNVKKVGDVIDRETSEWLTEFRGALSEAERRLASKHS